MKEKNLNIMMMTIHGYVDAVPILSNVDTGGQVVYVLELSKNLARLGCKVDIYTRRFENQPEIEKVEENVRIIKIPCGPKKFVPKEYMIDYLPEYINNTKKYINDNNLEYDVINSHYWDGGYAGMKMSEILNIPHFHTPHSLGIWKKQGMEGEYTESEMEKKYNFKQRIGTEREIYHKSDILIATTPIQSSMFADDYKCDKEKVIVIPPGFDPDRFFPESKEKVEKDRKRLNLPEHYVFAVGRMASNKGYDLLIKAMKLVIDEIKEVKLLLGAGSETPTDDEKNMAKDLIDLASDLGIQNNIKHIYYVSDEDLPYFYRCADLFGLSSRYEPFGMTAIECMACGTPVVATARGGLKDALEYGKDGLFADPEDTADYAKNLLMILKDKDFKEKLSQNAAKKAQENFSWPNIGKKTLNEFKKIL